MKGIKGLVNWESKNVLIGKRIFLFCFGMKCMSGIINDYQETTKLNEFEIWADFIEPEYFREDLVINNRFTINEASKILGEGKVTEIV